jgi:broad specificity phosphatase PhoE
MERNPIERPKTPEAERHNVRVTLFRHGTAKYEQGKVAISEANDLTDEGRELVRSQAERLADELGQDEEITIWSSPMGRTLETATIVADVLRNKGFNIRLKKSAEDGDVSQSAENTIRVFEALEEVRGLDIALFSALVDGGSYTLEDGTEVTFDKSKTNPNNLSFQDYYYRGGYKKYLEDGENIPAEVQMSLNSLEQEVNIHHRFDRNVERVSKAQSDKKQRVIIVTHHVAMKDYTENQVRPADYINLD